MAAEFLPSNRTGECLVLNSNLYRVIRKKDNKTYWRCAHPDRTCSCTAVTINGDVQSSSGDHDHDNMEKRIHELRLKTALKENVQHTFQAVKRSYDTAVAAETAGLAGAEFDARVRDMPLFESVRSSVYRHRLKAYPALPQRREDIDLNGERSETLGNERFLSCNEDDMVIFASDDDLQRLSASEVLLVDGTFKCCPDIFFQFYTLHGCVMGQIFPLVFCLLPNKQQATYDQMFDKIVQSMAQRNLVLQPTRILMDFEVACINTLRHHFPNSLLTGCLFHFDQCVQRKIQSQEVGLGKLVSLDYQTASLYIVVIQ